MAKKPRQSHIPQQQPKRRRPQRRPEPAAAPQATRRTVVPPLAAEASLPSEPAFAAAAPVATTPSRAQRRLDAVRGSQEPAAVRVIPGQLPTFDRSYLMRELRLTSVISVALLGVIIALAFILR